MFIFCPLKPQEEKKPQLPQSVRIVRTFHLLVVPQIDFFLSLALPVGFRHAARRGGACVAIRFPHSPYPCPLPSTLSTTIQLIFNMLQHVLFFFFPLEPTLNALRRRTCCRAMIAARLKAEKCAGSESDGEAQPENCLVRANCGSQAMLSPVDNASCVMPN